MSETIIGVQFKDFVLFSATGAAAQYYMKITDDEDKMVVLDPHKILVCTGENGPRKHFTDYIKVNMNLNKVRSHGLIPSTPETASFLRTTLANALRSRGGMYEVFSILGGFDSPVSEHDDTPTSSHLYLLDYLGTCQAVPYAAHGYGATFVIAILDRFYRADMTAQEGVDLLQMCLNEVKKRLIISNPNFISRVITKNGVQLLENVH